MKNCNWSYFLTPQHSGDIVARQLLSGKPCGLHRRAAAFKSLIVLSASVLASVAMTALQ